MAQTRLLLPVVLVRPVQPASRGGFIFAMQEDQHIGLADLFPHAGRKGMFLGYLGGLVTGLLQAAHQRGFARLAWAHHADMRPGTARAICYHESGILIHMRRTSSS